MKNQNECPCGISPKDCEYHRKTSPVTSGLGDMYCRSRDGRYVSASFTAPTIRDGVLVAKAMQDIMQKPIELVVGNTVIDVTTACAEQGANP
jgi:hypothetical protein